MGGSGREPVSCSPCSDFLQHGIHLSRPIREGGLWGELEGLLVLSTSGQHWQPNSFLGQISEELYQRSGPFLSPHWGRRHFLIKSTPAPPSKNKRGVGGYRGGVGWSVQRQRKHKEIKGHAFLFFRGGGVPPALSPHPAHTHPRPSVHLEAHTSHCVQRTPPHNH